MSDVFDFIDEMKETKFTTGLFDFKEQMAVGDKGESDFLKDYSYLSPKKSTQDLCYDFLLTKGSESKKVELKTDDYDMADTPNFFIETVSDIASGKLGGPARALKDGVDYFVYYYLRNRKYFWFKTVELNDALAPLIASGKFNLKSIKNKGWTAQGYAIPRSELETCIFKKAEFS